MQHAIAALALLPNCFQTPEAEPRGILSIKRYFPDSDIDNIDFYLIGERFYQGVFLINNYDILLLKAFEELMASEFKKLIVAKN